ncbi:MAG: glycosyl hydrolase 53 family protein [Armatimonadota bacterium]
MGYNLKRAILALSIWTITLGCMGAPPTSRPFRMGFSPWPYAMSFEAVADTSKFITTYGDILSEQIDESIPWMESAKGLPYPAGFVAKMEGRRTRLGSAQKRLLYITPLNTGRNGLLAAYGEPGKPKPLSWEKRRINDPEVIKAYTAYCLWMVKFFKPDYLVCGIETNEYLKNVPDQWANFLVFSKQVRKAIKKAYPTLPVSESVTVHQLLEPKQPNMMKYQTQIKQFVADHDFFAVSFYPFLRGQKSVGDISKSLDFIRNFSNKPIAFCETGQPAETLEIESFKLVYPLTPEDQNAYMKTLFEYAQKDKYLFVIWWTYHDFDALWNIFPAEMKDLGRCWRDIGLLDQDGNKRISYQTWMDTLALPFKR